jgi:hypothetical protein
MPAAPAVSFAWAESFDRTFHAAQVDKAADHVESDVSSKPPSPQLGTTTMQIDTALVVHPPGDTELQQPPGDTEPPPPPGDTKLQQPPGDTEPQYDTDLLDQPAADTTELQQPLDDTEPADQLSPEPLLSDQQPSGSPTASLPTEEPAPAEQGIGSMVRDSQEDELPLAAEDAILSLPMEPAAEACEAKGPSQPAAAMLVEPAAEEAPPDAQQELAAAAEQALDPAATGEELAGDEEVAGGEPMEIDGPKQQVGRVLRDAATNP